MIKNSRHVLPDSCSANEMPLPPSVPACRLIMDHTCITYKVMIAWQDIERPMMEYQDSKQNLDESLWK